MKVEVLTGPQGGGKSREMRKEAREQPGLYLFALPTIELIDEQVTDFSDEAPGLPVRPVHSKSSGKANVARKLSDTRQQLVDAGVGHAVIVTTHEALIADELAGFEGWHARIDEAPAAVQAGTFNIGVTREAFEGRYDLTTSPGSEWSFVTLKGVAPGWKAVGRDTGASSQPEFHKRAAHPSGVFVRATDWRERDDIDWFAMWTPLSLAHFASVTVAGSSYTDSIGFRAAKALFDSKLGFVIREIREPRTGQPTIELHYFTDSHGGSKTFWSTSDGRLQIKLVCDHLGKKLPEASYWSGNEVVQHLMEHRLKGTLIKPVASGINKHRALDMCAFIFSSKPLEEDKAIKAVFGLSDEDIRHAREDEAIAQFVMRGALRNPAYGGPYTAYLYEKGQAERLRDHLQNIGFTQIDLTPETDAGLMSVERPRKGKVKKTPEEKEAKKQAQNEKAKVRMQTRRADAAKAAAREPGQPGNPNNRRKKD